MEASTPAAGRARGATVILAMGDGKVAAHSIDKYLKGKRPKGVG